MSDEKEKQETKEEGVEKTETEAAVENPEDRHKSKADIEIERINADTERIEKAIADNANAKARLKLGGGSEAGSLQEKPKEETPKEYNTRIEKEISEGKHDE